MTTFSDHLVFVDESGDHSLAHIDPDYPVFVLAFCIVRKADYLRGICPALQALKHRYWGHCEQVLHEHEIRKPNKDYPFLFDHLRREAFLADITTFVAEAPFSLVTVVIRKDGLKKAYSRPDHPYELALLFGLERVYDELRSRGDNRRLTPIIVERRGKQEDASLELEFRRICERGCAASPLPFEMVMRPKLANSIGLQLADLVSRPVGIQVLRPHHRNRPYETLASKFRRTPAGSIDGCGLKVFP